MRIHITEAEARAVICLIDETLSGGTDDLGDALGCSTTDAERLEDLARSAIVKIEDVFARRADAKRREALLRSGRLDAPRNSEATP